MVVDLPRPGTAPISSETILWFEFLLDQKRLAEHLRNPNAEPSATKLITEFLSVDSSNGILDRPASPECALEPNAKSTPPSLGYGRPFTRKQLALKILALKSASTLKWNLDTFETKLTPVIQHQLVQDLIFMASDGAYSAPPKEICMNMIKKPQMLFALTLYHRWILRFPANAALEAKSEKNLFIHFPGMLLDNSISNFKKILRTNENKRFQSIEYLENVIVYYESHGDSKEPKRFKVPVMDTFVQLTEDMDSMSHNWDAGSVYVNQYEYLMQIHFDLCYNYFFYGQNEEAKKHILGCKKNQKLLEYEVQNKGYGLNKVPWGNLNYASVSEEDILGYIRALNLGEELLDEGRPLLQRLQESVANDYIGIIAVLQEDNLSREIPMIHRQAVEIDIKATVSTGAISIPKDLLNRVSALNAVRYTLEGGLPSTHPDFLVKFKTIGVKFFDTLFWALAPILTSRLSEVDWHNLRMLFLHLATSQQSSLPIDKIDEFLKKHVGDRALEIRAKLISKEHLEAIIKYQKSDDENMNFPRLLFEDNWDTNIEPKAVPELDLGQFKKRLMTASSAEDIRLCLVNLATMSPTLPLWKLNPYCKPIGNLETLLAALPRGFLQDFCVLVTGAARSRMEAGDARAALSLMSVVESEARNQLAGGNNPALLRLCRELAWEVLLLQVDLLLSEWPHHRLNVALLANKCKAAIAAANGGNAPRSQVLLAAWLGLLNMREWEPSVTAGAAADAGDLAAALCAACAELQRGKGARKLPRALWDHVLNAFNNSIGHKKRRRSSHHNSPNYQNQTSSPYHLVIQGLREPLAVTIVLSLLAKIYNILVDDSMELVVEYTGLWPDRIANMDHYKPEDVLESLTDLLERSLKLYPYNTSWLRLYGDVELTAGRYAAAVKHYLCALAAGSQHFTTRAPDEGGVVRRAARCCHYLAAPTQAAALSQLGEPDYNRAFKCLTEKIANAADSVDAYYGCLWDGALLEAALAVHARRGEAGRRARAITAIGALELNANNTEDIRRDAAAVRRARLLRSLTDQYVC